MMNKVRILVVEDKKILAQDLVDRLESFGYNTFLGPYDSGESALEASLNTIPDIAILDIRLKGEMTGIQLAKRLNEIKKIPIIYLTNQEDEATYNDSVKTLPAAFINKPFTNNELKSAINSAMRMIDEEKPDFIKDEELKIVDDRIFIRNGRGKYYIKLEDILWIQSHGGETSNIMTIDKIGEKVLPVVGHNLSRLEKKLVFYPFIVRASRFYMINLKHVVRLLDHQPDGRSTLKKSVLIADNEIILGDKYRKSITDKIYII